LGSQIVSWAGAQAAVGTATRIGIQLTISFFAVLPAGRRRAWQGFRPFIPFSAKNRDPAVRQRHLSPPSDWADRAGLVGLAFWATGPRTRNLGAVVVIAILPVGQRLIWGRCRGAGGRRLPWRRSALPPGHPGGHDNVIRPYVFRRWARIHPFITVIGAFAGINWFGLLGLLIGPLAISYFFELIRMYRDEYLQKEDEAAGG
jgi:hypothetical protein